MKKLLIISNILFLLVIVWQDWRIQDVKRDADMAWEHRDFWHNECAHWKIYGKGT